MFKVKKITLLMIAGIVWLIAGFNVTRLGIISYKVIDRKWYLYVFILIIFILFGNKFYKMTKNILKEYYPMKIKENFGIFSIKSLIW